MEKYFGNAYRGDSGVPHSDPDRFVNIWIGSAAFSALTWINPYMWQLSNQFKPVEVGMTKLCYMSNIIGRKHVKRNNHTNFCGIKWREKYETRTTSTGRSTFLRLPVAHGF